MERLQFQRSTARRTRALNDTATAEACAASDAHLRGGPRVRALDSLTHYVELPMPPRDALGGLLDAAAPTAFLASPYVTAREAEMRRIGDHAVVLGAGIAGLLATRVVAEAYERVTVVERDPLLETAATRQGVPQGRHAHNLLPSGAQIIGELFPGVLDDLEAGGAPVVRDFTKIRFCPAGHLLRLEGRSAEPLIYQPSRPYLEGQLRTRVRALPTVEIAERTEAVGLAATATRDRITGVRIVRRAARAAEETLDADLVVDATGRGGRTPAWLATLGCEQPTEERLRIDVKYASRHVRLPAGALGGEQFIAIGATPRRPTGLVLFAQEEDRWILTAIGYGGHHPPSDPEGFLAFVETVAPPDVFAAILDAEPLDDIVTYRFPADVRRRYDRLRHFPAGLLVFGDAVCSSNPSYALGMSVAALQAVALRDALAAGGHDLTERFFRAAAKPTSSAWRLTVGTDLTLAHVHARRPLPVRLINAYVEKVLTAAERDPMVAEQFVRVAALQHPFGRLLRPSMALHVLLGGLRPAPIPPTGRRAVTADSGVRTARVTTFEFTDAASRRWRSGPRSPGGPA
jgi:2-polyprenyl-6-methoxyphenol hydroxylase-like FAD-dependent oxidoreductase